MMHWWRHDKPITKAKRSVIEEIAHVSRNSSNDDRDDQEA